MEMFYLIVIKPDSQAIFPYQTLGEAKANFHGEMQYAYNAKIETTCMVIDNHGNIMHPVEENDLNKE